MAVILPILLIAGGLGVIFYFRPKIKNNITEVKYMQTKTISEFKTISSNRNKRRI